MADLGVLGYGGDGKQKYYETPNGDKPAFEEMIFTMLILWQLIMHQAKLLNKAANEMLISDCS